MRQATFFSTEAGLPDVAGSLSRRWAIGLILVTALLAFEIFNFDTTRFALADFLGQASFAGLRWATILAVAFCAIDFAGLAYLFAPESRTGAQREVWYLMGAWLLGATMNALMTWWAVSLTLLSHDLGNEVMSRADLLEIVPIFVAILVWLTRILFIGAFSVAGNELFGSNNAQQATVGKPPTATRTSSSRPVTTSGSNPSRPQRRPAVAARARRRN
ncbi:MAG: hypothetical protein R3300_01130 [Candidatus Promineifilaceae bacterium]|nr:hypothetical protein [Candidatus Promineifilaceae bacterium]